MRRAASMMTGVATRGPDGHADRELRLALGMPRDEGDLRPRYAADVLTGAETLTMFIENNRMAALNQIFTIDAPEPAFVNCSAGWSDAVESFERFSQFK
jgi:hypothetical protein